MPSHGLTAMDEDRRHTLKSAFLTRLCRPLVQPVLWVAGTLLIWEVAGRILEFNPEVVPTPSRILFEWIQEYDGLRAHGIITGAEMLGSFFLSLALSIPTAAVLALVPALYNALVPAMSALKKAPLIAATPLAFIWLGFGFRSILLLACLLSFLTLTLGFVRGLRSVSDNALDLMRIADAGPLRTFFMLRLPSSLPRAFAAMKAVIPLIVSVVAVGEFVDGEAGLGYMMLAAAFKLETSLVLASFATLMLIGLLLYGAIALAEKLCLRT